MPEVNQEEFIRFYDTHAASIYRYIFLRVSSIETAQDLTSEVFLRSWQYLNNPVLNTGQNSNLKTQKLDNPRPFFYQVARNLVIDFYRQKSKKEIPLEEISSQIPDLDNDPSEKTNLALEIEPVREALSKIKEEYAEVIIWHYLDELTIPEIAEILDKPEGTVRVMLHRGLKTLREKL